MLNIGDISFDFVSGVFKFGLGDSAAILTDAHSRRSSLADSVSMLWYSSDGGGGGGGLGLGAGGCSMARVGGLYLGALGIRFGRFFGDGILEGDRIRDGEEMLDED